MMKISMKTLACSVAVVAATAVSAGAATLTVESIAATNAMLGTLAGAGTTTLPTGATFDHSDIVSGSVNGQYRSPFENISGGDCSGTCSAIQYYTVGSNAASSASPATLSFSKTQSNFSMLWGSVDAYNTLDFYNGATLVFTALGDGSGPDGVNPGSGRGAVFVKVAGLSFDKVQFTSSQAAFEFSNISTVPVPAAGLLLLTAFGGFAALRRRKAA